MTRAEIAQIIGDAAQGLWGRELPTAEVNYAQAGFGDFSTNLPFAVAKAVGKNPREVAAELAATIQHPDVKTAEAAGGGYVNLTMTQGYWVRQLAAIGRDYGSNQEGQGQKVQVEFISANPTGPTTIGNARGGFIGDVLANVLEYSGYDVTREYYFNNAGTQISKLLEAVKDEAGIAPAEDRQYRGDYIKQLATEFREELASQKDDQLKELITNAILERYIRPAVEAMGIHFDVWFNERNLINDGSFDRTIARLKDLNLIFERDGAVWLKTGELGDDREERVLIKSNGDPTYMAPDIAYHVNIFETRGFDYAIKVLGPDHIAQFPSVYAAVHALFPDKRFTMASYQWLRLMKDGREVKVSKRLGQFVTIQELIGQVGLPVARFLTLLRSPDSHMDFDLDLATEQSAKNPYYYVMYAYARANSILAKAAAKGLGAGKGIEQLSNKELALVRQMAQLPELVSEIAADYGVHRLTFYGLELAKLFQDYYESTKIIDLPPDESAQKLYLVQQFIAFMDSYWSLMGIAPQKHMEQQAVTAEA